MISLRSRIIWLLLMMLSSYSVNGTDFEFLESSRSGMGGAIDMARPSSSTMLVVPISSPGSNSWSVQSGYRREFELKEFDSRFVAVARKQYPFMLAVGLMQFGQSDYYSERSVRLAAAWGRSQYSLGASVTSVTIDFGDRYSRLTSSAFGLTAAYVGRRFIVAISAENLNSPQMSDSDPVANPRYNVFFELVKLNGFSLAGRGSFEKWERPQFGLGQKLALGDRAGSVFWGISSSPLTYGGGLSLALSDSRMIYSMSVHPALGLSQSLSFGYHFGEANNNE